MSRDVLITEPDVISPFGAFAPSRARLRLLRIAQQAPRNLLGKQLAGCARALYRWSSSGPADVCVDELRLRCYLRDNTGERKFVFTPWRFDPLERAELARSLPADGVFVDVGANVGIYTLCAALRLGPTGRILALEPFPAASRRLRYNIAATRMDRTAWPRIEVIEIGASDRDELRELRIDEGNLGGGTIVTGKARFSPTGSCRTLVIRCRPLLDILRDQQVPRVDVLKIDIEGAEDLALVPFLRDAPRDLLPRRIIVENSEELWRLDLAGALRMRGYARRLRTRLNSVFALGENPAA